MLDVPEGESELHLRRSDLESFERGIKRWRYFLVREHAARDRRRGRRPACGSRCASRRRSTPSASRTTRSATRTQIAIGRPVTGYIGKRHSPTEGDRDVFVVPAPSQQGKRDRHGARDLRRRTSTSTSSLADGDGLHGATADEGGVGDDEVLHRRAVDGKLVITVGETVHDKFPVENVSDPYTLTVTEDSRARRGRAERASTPTRRRSTTAPSSRATSTAARDVDVLRWTGGDGTFTVVVRADGVPLAWHGPDGQARTPGLATVALHHGDVLKLDRTDATGTGPVVARDKPWSIVVTKASPN